MSLKEAILNAAEHVFATHDYDGTSMRLIAAILSRMSSGMRRPSDERKTYRDLFEPVHIRK